MIISFSKRFIFLANLKSASTSIERALRPFGDIIIDEARFGKHASLASIKMRYDWLFQVQNLKDFFVFGVIRDPISYLVSLYNAHSDPKFATAGSLFTGTMTFDEFLETWVPEHYDQSRPQYHRFVDEGGFLAANLVIDFAKLGQGLELAIMCTGVKELNALNVENMSINRFSRDEVTEQQASWIESHYDDDYRLIDNSANVIRNSDEAFPTQYKRLIREKTELSGGFLGQNIKAPETEATQVFEMEEAHPAPEVSMDD